jgi:hypothetical protein
MTAGRKVIWWQLRKKDAHGNCYVQVRASRQLAYGVPPDSLDDYLRMAESTCIEWLQRFCRAMVKIYKEQYLRRPTADDIKRLVDENKKI